MTRFHEAIAQIDAVNATDPNRVVRDGEDMAKELVYSQRMTARLGSLYPDASEALRIAVHAQHIARWRSPRGDYPEGRAGYKKWRSDLLVLHAETTGEILSAVGYDVETIERVAALIKKTNRAVDAEAQALEDVACLVFLEHYFEDFAANRDDDALVVIVRKTWKKMSAAGHGAALTLALSERAKAIVGRALGGGTAGTSADQ